MPRPRRPPARGAGGVGRAVPLSGGQAAAVRFEDALRRAGEEEAPSGAIGTLGERTLHRVLKYYYAPDPACHEARVGRYVADIMTPEGEIVEIQTRAFYRLREKLGFLLQAHPVSVVYPVARVKWLRWVSAEDGAVSPRRKSPRRGMASDALYELYNIRDLLGNPRLRLVVALLDMEEYRLLDGWGRGGKRGSHRSERIPLALVGEVAACAPADYAALLPPGLPERFTSADFAAAARLSPSRAQAALNVLHHLQVARRVDKQGRRYVYALAGEVLPAGGGPPCAVRQE